MLIRFYWCAESARRDEIRWRKKRANRTRWVALPSYSRHFIISNNDFYDYFFFTTSQIAWATVIDVDSGRQRHLAQIDLCCRNVFYYVNGEMWSWSTSNLKSHSNEANLKVIHFWFHHGDTEEVVGEVCISSQGWRADQHNANRFHWYFAIPEQWREMDFSHCLQTVLCIAREYKMLNIQNAWHEMCAIWWYFFLCSARNMEIHSLTWHTNEEWKSMFTVIENKPADRRKTLEKKKTSRK